MPESTSRRALFASVALGVVVAASLAVSPARVVGALESLAADPLVFGLAVLGLYLVRPLLAWPTTPLAAVVGYGYGIALGVPVALVGVLLTVTPVFLAARWVADGSGGGARPALPFGRVVSGTNRVVTRYFETAGQFRGVTAARLAPIPSDVATCGAAISGVRLRWLLVGTAVGELPWTVAAVVVGASTATVTSDGLGELGLSLALACTAAAAIVLAPPAYRFVRTRSLAAASN